VAFARELFTQLDVVENLSVEGDPQTAVGVLHGLVTGGEIDDAQTRVGQANGGVGIHPVVVRAAVPEHLDHAAETARLGRRAVQIEDACYSTHFLSIGRRLRTNAASSAEPSHPQQASNIHLRMFAPGF